MANITFDIKCIQPFQVGICDIPGLGSLLASACQFEVPQTYGTIQSAIDAAVASLIIGASSAVISICAGSYTEDLTIPTHPGTLGLIGRGEVQIIGTIMKTGLGTLLLNDFNVTDTISASGGASILRVESVIAVQLVIDSISRCFITDSQIDATGTNTAIDQTDSIVFVNKSAVNSEDAPAWNISAGPGFTGLGVGFYSQFSRSNSSGGGFSPGTYVIGATRTVPQPDPSLALFYCLISGQDPPLESIIRLDNYRSILDFTILQNISDPGMLNSGNGVLLVNTSTLESPNLSVRVDSTTTKFIEVSGVGTKLASLGNIASYVAVGGSVTNLTIDPSVSVNSAPSVPVGTWRAFPVQTIGATTVGTRFGTLQMVIATASPITLPATSESGKEVYVKNFQGGAVLTVMANVGQMIIDTGTVIPTALVIIGIASEAHFIYDSTTSRWYRF